MIRFNDISEVAVDAALDDGVSVVPGDASTDGGPDVVADVTAESLDDLRAVVEDFATEDARRYDALADALSDGFADLRGALSDNANSDSASDSECSIVITDDQWEFLRDSLRVNSTCALFSLILVSVLSGVILWALFSRGWTRG